MSKFTHDKIKDNWQLIEEGTKSKLKIKDLELVSFLENESYISGEEMKKRAKKLGAELSQYDAEYLLENQKNIPKEWREHYLVFPGTIWRVSGGGRRVPCLHWDGGRWYLYFLWLDGGWHSDDRFVRPRNSKAPGNSDNSKLLDSLESRISVLEEFADKFRKAME